MGRIQVMKPYSTTISGLTSVFWWFQTGQRHSILKSRKKSCGYDWVCCCASPIENIDVLNISNINIILIFNLVMTSYVIYSWLGTVPPNVKGGFSEISMKPKWMLHYSMNLTQTPQAHTHTHTDTLII